MLRDNTSLNVVNVSTSAGFNQYASTLIDPNSNAITKRLWSYIKSKKVDHTGVGTLRGSTYTDSQDKAQLLTDYFTSVFTQEDTSHIPELNDIEYISDISAHRWCSPTAI